MNSNSAALRAVLFFAGAPSFVAAHALVPHATLRTARVEYTMTLRDQDGKSLSVTWTTEKSGIYEVRIVREAGADETRPISLFNLGVQGRLRNTTIVAASARRGKIEILDGHGVAPAWVPAGSPLPWDIPSTNPPPEWPNKWNDQPVAGGNIWFLKFAGPSCQLTLRIPAGPQSAGTPIPFPPGDSRPDEGHAQSPPRTPPE